MSYIQTFAYLTTNAHRGPSRVREFRFTSIDRLPSAIPGPPKQCEPAPAYYTDCRTFSWNIDASGNPSSAFDSVRQFDSIAADCLPKDTLEADQAEMAKRGIALTPVEILDYAGSFTGKPRPIK